MVNRTLVKDLEHNTKVQGDELAAVSPDTTVPVIGDRGSVSPEGRAPDQIKTPEAPLKKKHGLSTSFKKTLGALLRFLNWLNGSVDDGIDEKYLKGRGEYHPGIRRWNL